MLTLYTFGPGFGLPDPSPFVMKAMILLKMAGVEYAEDRSAFRRAPKGKLPFIDDNGTIVADSTFIRFYLERRYGVDFDRGLGEAAKAAAWAVERMCEDHLYFAMIEERWMDDANFESGPKTFFKRVPAPLRPLVTAAIRRGIRNTLKSQGIGRHSKTEIAELAGRDIDAIAALLRDRLWLMGAEPCGADATAAAFVAGMMSKTFESPLRARAEGYANLVAYRDRAMAQFFPGLKAG